MSSTEPEYEFHDKVFLWMLRLSLLFVAWKLLEKVLPYWKELWNIP